MPLKKLCLPHTYTSVYYCLPHQMKKSITKVTGGSFSQTLEQFENLNHIVIIEQQQQDLNNDTFNWKLPKIVTKITSFNYSAFGFIQNNKSIKKLKLLDRSMDDIRFLLFLKDLSSSPECTHVQTFIYGCSFNCHIPNDLYINLNYTIKYSRTSLDYNFTQYLKFTRN
ncbi:hypothetical protein DFA_04697 [Cavenderia fasciculata]|uniref:Uncharacterized protein n=1 Tax=Cavenderia fasciculata TaxID=261658 RepID=F4PQA4_CACFS|nr:uncharacterized protein DFA_04697 [Cavenderia fasciculata]EGG22567.1 hypothetical protein DFA_04697 [Cavenderia fasciculata]|eukprot:XP_004360418.1 hypothetical protein DFA_04697 [Cavenderia fasciculata]